MNKLKKVIASLESNYNINTADLLTDYRDGLSVENMAANQGITIYAMRTVLQHLQLKRCKTKRAECLAEFMAMAAEDTIDDYTQKLEDEIAVLVEKTEKLEKSLILARDNLTIKRKQQRQQVRAEDLLNTLTETFDEALKDMKIVDVKPSFNSAKPNTPHEEGLVLVLSDLHIGDVVGSDVVQNKFNYKIALERIDKLVDNVLAFPVQSKTINVIQCGDLIKGLIHGGIYTSEDSFVDSIIKAVDYNVYVYSVLSAVYDNVVIHSTTGNHDRISEDPANAEKSLDFTKLIDTMVARQLVAKGVKNIKFLTTQLPYQLVKVNGANILGFHGDTVRRYNPSDASQRSLLQDICLGTFKVPYRHAVSGHTHQFMACHNQYDGFNITNGTLVGTNAYGTSNGFRDIAASQTVFFVEPSGEIEFIKAVKL